MNRRTFANLIGLAAIGAAAPLRMDAFATAETATDSLFYVSPTTTLPLAPLLTCGIAASGRIGTVSLAYIVHNNSLDTVELERVDFAGTKNGADYSVPSFFTPRTLKPGDYAIGMGSVKELDGQVSDDIIIESVKADAKSPEPDGIAVTNVVWASNTIDVTIKNRSGSKTGSELGVIVLYLDQPGTTVVGYAPQQFTITPLADGEVTTASVEQIAGTMSDFFVAGAFTSMT